MINFNSGFSTPLFVAPEVMQWRDQPAPAWAWQTNAAQPAFVPPAIDLEEKTTTYKKDAVRNLWELERVSSKGKVKIVPLTNGFSIDLCELLAYDFQGFSFVRISYSVDGKSYKVIMSAEDYLQSRFDKYLTKIVRLPDCKRHIFNDLVRWLLHTVPVQDIHMFEHQGWNTRRDGTLVFASWYSLFDIPEKLVPRSVLKREYIRITDSLPDIMSRWRRIHTSSPQLLFAGYYRLGSLLLKELKRADVKVRKIPVFRVTDEIDEQKSTAVLATNNTSRFPVKSLVNKEVLEELSDTRDGVALFEDRTLPGEETQRENAVRSIIRSVQTDDDNDRGRNLPAIISFSGSTILAARQLDPDIAFEVPLEGCSPDFSTEEIRRISNQMEGVFRHVLQSEALRSSLTEFIKNAPSTLEKTCSDAEIPFIQLLFGVEFVFRNVFDTEILNDSDFDAIRKMILTDYAPSPAQMIIQDFAAGISTAFKNGDLHPVRKRKNVPLSIDDQTALISGSRVLLSLPAIECAMSQMHLVKSGDRIIKELRDGGYLITTDGNAHRIEVHNAEGRKVPLYWYDIPIDLLDADVIQRLSNVDGQDFWLAPPEIPNEYFVPLLSDGAGRVAGIVVKPDQFENQSIFFSGQSGWGKTFGESQVMAEFYANEGTIVCLDASSSQTEKALSRNLSADFVQNNIHFFDIDRDGIPVNLFHFAPDYSLTQKKRRLIGLFSAAIGELSTTQSDVLQSAVTELLKKASDKTEIKIGELLSLLNKEGTTFSSLRTRLQPLLEDIEQCGMSTLTWDDLFRQSGRFVVLRTDSAFTETGCALMDMILASLFDYQQQHSDQPLIVVIDEIQAQNLSMHSPVRKVVTEGRKYGMSLIAASQDFPSRSTDLGKIVGKMPTQVFLRPTLNAETAVASELHYSKSEMMTFDTLERGDAIVKGNLYSKKAGRNVPGIVRGKIHHWSSATNVSSTQILGEKHSERGNDDD